MLKDSWKDWYYRIETIYKQSDESKKELDSVIKQEIGVGPYIREECGEQKYTLTNIKGQSVLINTCSYPYKLYYLEKW
jgi:hypothetical protein